MIKFRSNNIVLIGDCHGLQRVFSAVKYSPALQGLDIVQIGDFGLGFMRRELDEINLRKVNTACVEKDIHLYAIRGNHDLIDFWNRKYEFSNLHLVPDYTEAVFPNGKTALLVGGGVSIGRIYRTEGLDYWTSEATPYQKMDKKFDVLLCHDAPDYFNNSTESLRTSPFSVILRDDPPLFEDALKQRNVIGKIVDDIQPQYIFGGHFHNRRHETLGGIVYRCIDCEEKVELDATKLL